MDDTTTDDGPFRFVTIHETVGQPLSLYVDGASYFIFQVDDLAENGRPVEVKVDPVYPVIYIDTKSTPIHKFRSILKWLATLAQWRREEVYHSLDDQNAKHLEHQIAHQLIWSEFASITAFEKVSAKTWDIWSRDAFRPFGSAWKPCFSSAVYAGFSWGMIHCAVRWNNESFAALVVNAPVIWTAEEPVPITPTRSFASATSWFQRAL